MVVHGTCLQEGQPYLGDVRGLGLMLGIECVSDAATLLPAPKLACWLRVRGGLQYLAELVLCSMQTLLATADLFDAPCGAEFCTPPQERMKARHVLLTTDGTHCDNVLKVKPPLVFSCRDADRLVAELEVWRISCAARASLKLADDVQLTWAIRRCCARTKHQSADMQAVLEEFAGLTTAEQAALLEPWEPASVASHSEVGTDVPMTGPAGKRHKA